MLTCAWVEARIAELMEREPSMAVCERLAWLYTVRDALEGAVPDKGKTEEEAEPDGELERLAARLAKGELVRFIGDTGRRFEVTRPSEYNLMLSGLKSYDRR